MICKSGDEEEGESVGVLPLPVGAGWKPKVGSRVESEIAGEIDLLSGPNLKRRGRELVLARC